MVARLRTWTLGLTLVSGCTTWAPRPIVPGSAPLLLNGPVRVTETDSSVVTLHDVRIGNDSLVGTTGGRAPSRVSVPIATVSRVETRESSASRTTLLVVAILAADVLGSAAFATRPAK
jgi:hypothetical protein